MAGQPPEANPASGLALRARLLDLDGGFNLLIPATMGRADHRGVLSVEADGDANIAIVRTYWGARIEGDPTEIRNKGLGPFVRARLPPLIAERDNQRRSAPESRASARKR